MLTPLPEMELTLSNLAVELLLLEKQRQQRYRDLLLADPDNNRCVRMTMHYTMALLAYGFTPQSAKMQEIARWFDRPFPKREKDEIDPREMNRLRVLLHLKPYNENVQTRLTQLIDQRVADHFDVQPSWGGFDTLWAMELFHLAQEQGVLSAGLLDLAAFQTLLPRLIDSGELKRDKDIALAVLLQHKLYGELMTDQLDYLIRAASMGEGVWGQEELGWRLKHMGWRKKFVAGNKLIPEDVRAFQEQFRRVMLSTCMVIEYLTPLAKHYPALQPPIEQAMKLLWEQFYGKNAAATLRALFPRSYEYDYVMVLCRSLRALRQYVCQPICTLDSVQLHILSELAAERYSPADPPDIHNIKQALRHWIRVDLDGEVEPLKLGFSEANVVRVQPHIWSPMFNDPQAANSLITQSLIIKYGPEDMIRKERENYERLPNAVRDCFVRIPESSYTDPVSRKAFVVMQDLRNYKTLYEVHEAISQNVSDVADQLGPFLRRMHEGGSERMHLVSKSLLREIYLRKMMEYVDRIFDFMWDNHLFSDQRQTLREIQDGLFREIGELTRRQGELAPFPAAVMHGDLHMRNIMIYGLKPGEEQARNGVVFRLIDLEYCQPDGDAAFDAGQLLMDIELISREESEFESQNQLMRLKDSLERSYMTFSHQQDDPTFGVRMTLAKARALLRIAKGKVKRGSIYHTDRQIAQAEKIAEEVLGHAGEAWQYLQTVVGALR